MASTLWLELTRVWLAVRRHPLPEVVVRLKEPPRRTSAWRAPRRLGKMNDRVLHVGPYRPRCLYRALVHLRMLARQGDDGHLIIGLAESGTTKDAHAWIELAGVDVGPAPGRAGHVELVRFPSTGDAEVPR